MHKFGGARNLARALCRVGEPRTPSAVYKWLHPKGSCQGTGGLIPTRSWEAVLKAARNEGIILTAADCDPVEFLKPLLPAEFRPKKEDYD